MIGADHDRFGDLIRIRSSSRGHTDHDPGQTGRPVGDTQGRERFGESFVARVEDEELEDEEELEQDPNHAPTMPFLRRTPRTRPTPQGGEAHEQHPEQVGGVGHSAPLHLNRGKG
jgi:hypothetical protein